MVAALGSRADALMASWRRTATGIDPAVVWQAIVEQGIGVAVVGSAGYPPVLAADIEPPGVVFHRGSPDVVAGPRWPWWGRANAVPPAQRSPVSWAATWPPLASRSFPVSHRASTPPGTGAPCPPREAASAPPIGVVGSGLDVVYPRGQAELWRAVAVTGVLLSEAPLGARPERWRFPARNRIIAALADLVVVVESHRPGGSLHTVDEADRRGIDVMAVPGSVRAPASAGTNGLLAEGRAPACSADDVLVALGLGPAGRRSRDDARPGPTRPTTRYSTPWDGSPPPSIRSGCARATAWRSWPRRSTGCARRDGWRGAAAGTRGSPGDPMTAGTFGNRGARLASGGVRPLADRRRTVHGRGLPARPCGIRHLGRAPGR